MGNSEEGKLGSSGVDQKKEVYKVFQKLFFVFSLIETNYD